MTILFRVARAPRRRVRHHREPPPTRPIPLSNSATGIPQISNRDRPRHRIRTDLQPYDRAQGKNLSFLQAFVQECLRFNSPVSSLNPKAVPPKGDTLDGIFILGDTKIGTNFWSMGRRTDIFGEDVSVFRPERFLEASPTERTRMEKTTDNMFG